MWVTWQVRGLLFPSNHARKQILHLRHWGSLFPGKVWWNQYPSSVPSDPHHLQGFGVPSGSQPPSFYHFIFPYFYLSFSFVLAVPRLHHRYLRPLLSPLCLNVCPFLPFKFGSFSVIITLMNPFSSFLIHPIFPHAFSEHFPPLLDQVIIYSRQKYPVI